MKEKVAILGYTKEEASRYKLFEFYNIEDAECIAMNHSNFLAHNDFDNYIDHKILHEDIAVLPKQIAYTWYRNNQYIDNYKNQFSVGIAMQTKVAALISYTLKYYFHLYYQHLVPHNFLLMGRLNTISDHKKRDQ